MTSKINSSNQNVNDLSPTFKSIMQKYSSSLGSHHKINRLSQNIKSYILNNFAKKNALIGDDVDDYLPKEFNHLSKSHHINNIIQMQSDNDNNTIISNANDISVTNKPMQIPTYTKLNPVNIRAKSNIKRDNERNNRKCISSYSSISHNTHLFSTSSKANNSLVIQSRSLLPILALSTKVNNDKEFNLIRCQIKENIERNIKKKRRLYDQQYDKLIGNAIHHPKSLRVIGRIKLKYPLSYIQHDINKIEGSFNDRTKQAYMNLQQFKDEEMFLNKRLNHLLSLHKEK